MAFEPQPFGKYYLLERIATGGMAEIYKAKTFGVVGFEKLLAIKRILPHLSQNADFIRMLIDEAKIAVQLNHVNIVQVYDLGKIGDDYFIAMEYIHGKDLRTLIKVGSERGYRMSVENAVYIVVEICKGLDYAHRKKDQFELPSGIVHRDISPQNILISFEGEVKIVDFGIAKAERKATETEAGVLKGKFSYMSPEQARGEEVDQRTDIFSTGIILYELLTGTRLFQSDNNMKTLDNIRQFEIAPPFLPMDVPSELEFIVMQALQNKPEDRYQYANDFQVDLTKFLYSSALDFTSKNLADLMADLFREDVRSKAGKGKIEDKVSLDTQTRYLIEKANQEVLVTRGEDLTPSGIFEKPGGAGIHKNRQRKGKSRGQVPSPEELFKDISVKKIQPRTVLFAAVFVLAVLLIYYFRHGYNKTVKEIPAALTELYEKGGKAPVTVEKSLKVIPGRQASVLIETDPPGARIYLDGKEMNALTPTRVKDLEPHKEYKLVLSLQNYKPLQQTVTLGPGEVKKIELTLSHELGNLFLGSSPAGAEIYINDEAHGKTPREIDNVFANVDLPIKMRKQGYQDYFEVVRLQPNQTKILQAKLRKIEAGLGSIQIVSVPPGAKIGLDGVDTGKETPVTLSKIAVGREYVLDLHLDGYEEYSTKFRVSEGIIEPIKVYLKTKPEEVR